MADKVTSMEVYVLGERNFPLAPVSRLRGDLVEPLADIVTQAQQRMPNVGYDDVVKLLLRIGLSQVEAIFEAGGRIEVGGKLTFTPVQEGRKSAKVSALRTRLLESKVLSLVMLGEREHVPELETKPIDTIPVPQPAVVPVSPSVLDADAAARAAAGADASLP